MLLVLQFFAPVSLHRMLSPTWKLEGSRFGKAPFHKIKNTGDNASSSSEVLEPLEAAHALYSVLRFDVFCEAAETVFLPWTQPSQLLFGLHKLYMPARMSLMLLL